VQKLACSALLAFTCLAPALAGAQTASGYLEQHCTACHNDRSRVGGLSLSGADPARPGTNPELWEKVLHKLRTAQMPPAGRPRPDLAATHALVVSLENALDAAAAPSPMPARVGVHRLNRTEYANAARDLLGVEIEVKTLLLPDESDEGFDNVAASLPISPAHVDRYLTAARDISRLAVGDTTFAAAPASALYRVPRLLEQDVRTDDAQPFGSRGGLAVRHAFPLDGEYAFKIRLRRQIYDYIVGMGHAQPLDLRIDGVRVKRFTVGGEATGTPGPLTWHGEIVGETPYELYMHAADAALEVRVPVKAGQRTVSVSFAGPVWEPEGMQQPLQVDFGRGSDEQFDSYAAVDALSIAGPYQAGGPGDTASRRAIFTCQPKTSAEEPACARRIVSRLARRAYRRPPTGEEMETLLRFYDEARKARGFEAGIQAAIERMLASFSFLLRLEQPPRGVAAEGAYRLSDLDLASRLSFFLWSSIPDDRLLDVASKGQLGNPASLSREVQRMIRDPRASALVDNFAMQWLGLRKAQHWLPDPNVFPEFDENLRRAMLAETAAFVGSQAREDRSILDLVSADYSFVNERLAQHYGVPGVSGERLRKVAFADGARGGLLGQGGILMVTSYPDRTTPVLRGAWVLETLLGMPPPPPPPDVPELQTTADGRRLSMREQMESHRRSPACAVCHVRMDPLGFALENFDAIGRWRTTTAGAPVDARTEFADGTPIDGARGLRAFVLSRRDQYVHTFVEKLLTFGLGRRVDYRDQPAVRAIVREAATRDYRWSAIISALVKSTPFRMRTTAS
jgi:hypothetical protein